MNNIAFISTFPNDSWQVYSRQFLQSFTENVPYPLMVQTDDDLLTNDINKILRPNDGLAVGPEKDHKDFIKRNKDKDDPVNYRKQAVRFCHKVFAIHRVLDAAKKARKAGIEAPRYLIWIDADVLITRKVTEEDIKKCLPKEGDAVSYLGRKDWDHSECGWLAFDLDNGGGEIIESVHFNYTQDDIFNMEQWHDSWVWDNIRKYRVPIGHSKPWTNLTEGKPGTEIWAQSPMSDWSKHFKGPAAKQSLFRQPTNQEYAPMPPGKNFMIQTKNAIPHEEIRKQIEQNQLLIKNWIHACEPNDETIVIVSAGPTLVAEDLLDEVEKGRKIVAVKHALKPLREIGIPVWASILLDPRPHVSKFVDDAEAGSLWFVASQVNPEVTKKLLDKGCEVWGYHAMVGADENELIEKQPSAIINGGSATATRGLYMLAHLGFRNFHLYGYDLSFPDKQDMNERDQFGQPKYLEFNVGIRNQYFDIKRNFYSEPQLIAQFEEMKVLLENDKYNITTFGEGMIPFIGKRIRATRLRQEKKKVILPHYRDLWNSSKKTSLLARLPKMQSIRRLKQRAKNR